MKPTANSACFASLVTVGCCIYPVTPLTRTNNTFSNGLPTLTTGFYGTRGNINPFCNIPCFPEPLMASSGSPNNFINGLPKLRLADTVGIYGGIVIGNPTNNFCS